MESQARLFCLFTETNVALKSDICTHDEGASQLAIFQPPFETTINGNISFWQAEIYQFTGTWDEMKDAKMKHLNRKVESRNNFYRPSF